MSRHHPWQGLDEAQINVEVDKIMTDGQFDDHQRVNLKIGAILAGSAIDQPPLLTTARPPATNAPQEVEHRGGLAWRRTSSNGDEEPHLVLNVGEIDYLKKECEYSRVNPPTGNWKFWKSWFGVSAYERRVFILIGICALGAVVQGMIESAVNGAQIFYWKDLDIPDDFDRGLWNAIPYLVSAISCLLTPLASWLARGRRNVIAFTCFVSLLSCALQASSANRTLLLIYRGLLGVGIGLKSSTIPLYASECCPSAKRGALVMMWQMWTAFGILLGYALGAAFWNVYGSIGLGGLGWRLMLGIPGLVAIFPMLLIYCVPESPRYILRRALRSGQNPKKRSGLIREAFRLLNELNKTEIQAWREFFVIYTSLQAELGEPQTNTNGVAGHAPNGTSGTRTLFAGIGLTQLWTDRPTRRALWASMIVMFMQQFCGVNVLIYYSTVVLHKVLTGRDDVDPSQDGRIEVFMFSLVVGALNFLAAFPAIPLIEKRGRRALLLWTLPLLSICQFGLAACRTKELDSQAGMIVFMTLFIIIYSLGMGPVPFVYASESIGSRHRDIGMGIATGITWLFNFLLAVTWLLYERRFGPFGSFAWYGGWCIGGWVLVFLFVRETKKKRLEEMDFTFDPPFKQHRRFAWEQEVKWFFRTCFCRNTEVHLTLDFDQWLDREARHAREAEAREAAARDDGTGNQGHEMQYMPNGHSQHPN